MDLFEVTFHDASNNDENVEKTDENPTIVLEDEELLACRICLATDTKLISIHEFQLQQTFETIIGYTVAQDDGFPQYLCHYCCTLLTKFESFRGKYERAQYILTAALADDVQISTEYLRTLDRRANELSLLLDFHTTPDPISMEYVEPVKALKTIKIPAKKLKRIPNDQLVVQKIQEDGREIVRVFYMAKPEEAEHTQHPQDAQEAMEAVETLIQPKTEEEQNDGEYNTLEFGLQEEEEEQEDDYLLEVPRKRMKITEHPNIDVVILSETEQIEELQKRKKSVGYQSAFLKCDRCYRGFLREKSYLKHMAMHEPLYGEHECAVCSVRCASAGQLRAHARRHARRYCCRLCAREDSSAIAAKQHQVFHQEKQYECDICQQTFKQYMLLVKHKSFRHRTADDEPKLTLIERRTCQKCNIVFDTVSAYNVHLSTSSMHGEDGGGNCGQSCKKCGQSFENEEDLQEHAASHLLACACDECDARFVNEKGVAIHKGQSHKANPDYTCVRHICEFCGRDMESGDALAQHKLTHGGEKPFQCSCCGKTFRHAQFLQIHMRTHTRQAPYSCQLCRRQFTHKANLNRHYKVHTGEKPFKCNMCKNAFTQSNSLKLHIRTVHMKLPDPYRHNRKKKRAQPKQEKTIEELFPE